MFYKEQAPSQKKQHQSLEDDESKPYMNAQMEALLVKKQE